MTTIETTEESEAAMADDEHNWISMSDKCPIKLSESMIQRSIDGIEERLVHHGLTRSETMVTRRTKDRPIAEKTSFRYEQHFDQLNRFLILIGDYDSMILLLRDVPKHAPAMKIESLVCFMKYKYGAPGTPLKDIESRQVEDVDGNAVMCTGTWLAPKILQQFQAAISNLHRANDHEASYYDVCDACMELPQAERFKGCARHSCRPRLVRAGNPTKNESFKNAKTTIERDRSAYEENGTTPLIPTEVRDIRNYLISSNTIAGLQMYVILIVAIKLFLRFDEFSTLDIVDSFITELHVVSATAIAALCVQVQGKCDRKPVQLLLWADDEMPEFCPIRHLLIYVFLIGAKKGVLFPQDQELNNKPPDGHYKNALTYATILKCILDLIKKVVKKVCRVGTHTCRKTGYFFAIFGKGADDDIMQAARHKTGAHAKKYRQDAATLRTILETQGKFAENRVSKWKSNFLVMDGVNARALNATSCEFTAPVHKLAERFVFEHLGISRSHPKLYHPLFLIQKAMEYERPTGIEEKLDHLLESADPTAAQEIKTLFYLYGAEREQKARTDATAMAVDPPFAQPPNSLVLDGNQVKQKRKRADEGDNDLADRHELKKYKTAHEKITKMSAIWEQYESAKGGLTSAARTWTEKALKRAMGCLQHHCGNNKDTFCERWPTFKHYEFKECHGKEGETCTALSN